MSAPKRARRILLLGYYGFGNAGDEAVLAGLVKSLRDADAQHDIAVEIAALSIDPAATERDHGIKAYHRYQTVDMLKALSWCDLLAAGGGSLLQDVTSAHSIYYYLGVIRSAQAIGKRTMFIAQGVGPLDLTRSKQLTAAVAKRCDALTVRDTASAELLKSIGVTHPDINVTADPAVLLGSVPDVLHNPKSTIFISLRPWNGDDELVETLTICLGAAQFGDSELSPLACSQEDIAVLGLLSVSLEPTIRMLPNADVSTYAQIVEKMSDASIMIGMRLHALILASASGVPCVALSYDPKVRAFMEQTGQGDAVYDIRTNDPLKLSAIIQKVWESRTTIHNSLVQTLPALQRAARENATVALDIVDKL